MNASILGIVPVALAGLLLAASLPAQDDLIAKRDKKLAAEFLTNGDWITDYDEARETAAEQGKIIFAYFTRSYSP